LTGEDEPLHEARKRYKQARYAVEVFVPSVGKPAKKLSDRLTDVQDVLGAHQDSVVAREILHDLGHNDPEAFRYGILHAHQEQIGRNTFGDLPRVVQPLRERKLRRWLG
jgi:CHAD domain-containing protein